MDATPAKFSPSQFGLLLALALVCLFPGAVFGWATFIYNDFGALAYPCAVYARDSFWRGEIPHWNPLSNCGVPFMAQWGTIFFYPGALFYYVLPLPWSLNFFCVAHLWIGGMGMFYLLRHWRLSDLACAIGGLAFVFNGLTLACLTWPNYVAALALLPWVIRFALPAPDSARARLWPVFLVGSMQMLTGAPELIAMTWGLGFLLALAQLPIFSMRQIARVGLQCAGLFAVVLLLCAFQILPFLRLLSLSHRTGADWAVERWNLPVRAVANLLAPMFHTFHTPQGTVYPYGQTFLSSTYLGAFLLGLTVVALTRWRDRKIAVLGGVSIIAIWLALGRAGGLLDVVRNIIPGMSLTRYPVKFLLVLPFAIPALAAMAIHNLGGAVTRPIVMRRVGLILLAGATVCTIEAWMRPLPYDQPRIMLWNHVERAVLGFGLLFALPWLLRQRARPWLGPAIIAAVLTLDLSRHLPRQNPTVPPAVTRGVVAEFRDEKPVFGHGRLFLTREADDKISYSPIADLATDVTGKRLAAWSHWNLVEGLAKINGSATLQIQAQREAQTWLYATNAPVSAKFLDFLSATFQSSPDNPTEWVRRSTAKNLVDTAPLVEWVPREEIRRRVLDPEFDPTTRTLLVSISDPHTKTNAVQIIASKVSAHSIEIEYDAQAPGVITIAQSHYPAWRAVVGDGGVAQLLVVANHAFQGLEVPAGPGHARLEYRDEAFIFGAWISGATLLGILVVRARKAK